MFKDFRQTYWNPGLLQDWMRIVDLALREDLGATGDCTTKALVPDDAIGRAAVVARRAGVLAGEPAIAPTIAKFNAGLKWTAMAQDAQAVAPGQSIGVLAGPAAAMLSVERLLLNMLGRLSGIAALTRRYVDLVAGTRAGIYDTRKTTPGWRSLEKYAVRCGGGRNHRAGLYEAVLIKDNHLALGAELRGDCPNFRGTLALPNCVLQGRENGTVPLDARGGYSPAEAVLRARQYCEERFGDAGRRMIVEVEVDSLQQLDDVLAAGPDIVLLDNMGPAMLREAVARRDARNAAVELEASGGIDLTTVRGIAETGVERISVGALTHSAVALDFGLDWA
jgi:nicotinate-nucleotide pyrophosphorylase (carboxylating)